jgi:hypothetical protein
VGERYTLTILDPIAGLTEEQRTLILGAGAHAQAELAKRSFWHFLDFVKILEPQPGRGTISFERWPHLEEVCDILDNKKLLVWLKSRQTGASWMLAAYGLWMSMYKDGAVVLLLSQGEDEAKKLLAKCRFIYENLDPDMRPPLGIDSRQELYFPETGSSISALPSTEKAGRSSTASLVIMDEADFHEHLDSNYAAVKPTIDDVGGQLVLVSTSNAMRMNTLFKSTYKESPNNGFTRVFYGWNVRPDRDNAWYEARRAEYSDKSLFEKEYPANDEEALAPPRTIAAFDHDVLKLMQQDVREPVIHLPVGTVTANIYQDFHPGKRYAAASDTARGTGQDYAITVVLDAGTGYVVADIQSNLIPPDQLAIASMTLLARYHNPIWSIEDNDAGVLTVASAQAARYPSLYYRESEKPGWHTDERNRWLLWGELIEAVNARLITIPSDDGLAQFYSVIRNPEKDGRIEAARGAHDDYPMAVGIAWQMRRYAKPMGRAPTKGMDDSWGNIMRRSSLSRSRW